MNQDWRNIEDFVREKLGLLDGDSQPDWLAFERKLAKALWRRRLRRATGLAGLLVLLGFSQMLISGDWRQPSEEQDLPAVGVLKRAYKAEPQKMSTTAYSLASEEMKSLSSARENSPNTVEVSNKQLGSNTLSANTPVVQGQTSNLSATKTVNTQEAFDESTAELLAFEFFEPLAISKPSLEEALATIKKAEPVRPFLDSDLNRQRIRAEDVGYSVARDQPYISPLQEKKPWTYSLNIYPNFAFREFRIDRRKRALLHSDFIDAMQNAERSGLNMNVGFEVSRRVGAITYINTGVEYINNSYRAEFDFLNFRNANFDANTGEIINYSIRKDPQQIAFSNINSFHFLNIPFSVSYQPWATDHIRINLEFGFSALYFLKAQGSTIDYRTLETIDLNDRPYRKFMASSSLTIGLQYYVSSNMNIGIEPTMMYFTNSIYTEEYPFEVIPYSMGVNFKLQMKLQ